MALAREIRVWRPIVRVTWATAALAGVVVALVPSVTASCPHVVEEAQERRADIPDLDAAGQPHERRREILS